MQPRALRHDVQGTGEPLVLVPGGLTGWRSWAPHQERLSERLQAIRVQPIHNELGARGEIAGEGYDDQVERDSLLATLDALGLTRAHFAGWSGGARALIEFALEYPERVRSLTLIEPPAIWVAKAAGQTVDPAVLEVEALIERLGGRPVSEDDLAHFLRLSGLLTEGQDPRRLPQWETWLEYRHTLASQHRLGRTARSLAELASFEPPVLLVKGARSSSWVRELVDELARQFPHARVAELAGGHACHIEDIDAFTQVLEDLAAEPHARP